MHAAYVIGTSARNSRYILENKIKKTCSSSIIELYSHLGIFKNTREVRRSMSRRRVLLALLKYLYNSTMHSARFYISLIEHSDDTVVLFGNTVCFEN